MAEYVVVFKVMVGDEIKQHPDNPKNSEGVNVEHLRSKVDPGVILISPFEIGIGRKDACYKSNNYEDVT